MSRTVPPILTSAETRLFLDPVELCSRLERGFVAFSSRDPRRVVQPLRSTIAVPCAVGNALSNRQFFLTMPAYSAEDNVLSTKILTLFPGNKNKPSHYSIINLFDSTDGSLLAVMNGDAITEIRTSLASVIATKYLAPSTQNAVLCILGSGVQARGHYNAFSKFYNFSQVRVWGRTRTNADRFASEIGAVLCSTVAEATRDADIIVTATSSRTPILDIEHVKPGAHINCVGACGPDLQEVDPRLMREAIVYTDTREGAMAESGDVLMSGAEVYAEIGEVINGGKAAHKTKTTIFKSLGMGLLDAIAAKLVYDTYSQAQQQNSAVDTGLD